MSADNSEKDFTFRNALKERMEDISFLWRHKFKIIAISALGCLIGFFFAWIWPVSYTAKTTFVVEEGKSSGGGGLMSSLAGSFGLDLSSIMGGTSGILAGDNVQQLLISQKMLKETLLTPVEKNSKETIADRYVKVHKLNEKWEKHLNGNTIVFPSIDSGYTRLQDSLINEILRTLSEKQVSVSKPDKKLSFFALNTTMKDQNLAALFNEHLIEQASEFYIQTKTKRLRVNVDKLQHRADSLERLLNRKTLTTAVSANTQLDLNPAYVTAGVATEVQERDKRLIQTTYSEIVKNLEISRTMLIQETPTFQIVDTPLIPLRKNRLKYSTAGLAGIMIAGISTCLFLLVRFPRNK